MDCAGNNRTCYTVATPTGFAGRLVMKFKPSICLGTALVSRLLAPSFMADGKRQAECNKLLKAYAKGGRVCPSPFVDQINVYAGELTSRLADLRLTTLIGRIPLSTPDNKPRW